MPKIELIHGDCLEKMKDIPDKSIDMILCDLPYGTTACKWDTIIPFEPLWEQYKRIIKDNGAIVLTASQPFTSALVMSNFEWFRYCWYWKKEAGTGFLSSKKQPLRDIEECCIFYLDKAEISGRSKEFIELRDYFNEQLKISGLTATQIKKLLGNGMGGHYFTNGIQWTLPTELNYNKLQTTGFFKRDWKELKNIFEKISSKNLNTYNPQMKDCKPYIGKYSEINLKTEVYGNAKKIEPITKKYNKKYPTTTLEFSRDKDKLHPTQKPVALFEYLIKTYTNEGDIVLDNCMGSGTAGVACKNLNRNFIGIEKDPEYFKIAEKRINEDKKNDRLYEIYRI